MPSRKGKEVALVAFSSSGKTKKKKKSNKKKPSSASGPSGIVGKKSQTVKKKVEVALADSGKCFHCQKDGHWKRNCPEYLELVKNKKEPVNHKSLDHGEVRLKIGDGLSVDAKAIGSTSLIVHSYFDDNVLYLKDVLIPTKSVSSTLYEIWHGRQPSLKPVKVWGFPAFIKKLETDKLETRLYLEKVLKRFNMLDCKRELLPVRHGIHLSKEQSLNTPEEGENMAKVPYASAIGSLIYAMLCTRPDIAYVVSMTSRKSISGFVFLCNGGAICWKSSKQTTTTDSTTEAEYVTTCDAAKEAVWIKKFASELQVVPSIEELAKRSLSSSERTFWRGLLSSNFVGSAVKCS
ncbi:uncharacterized protein LOC131175825 [Hevea brasiliensis]|uniref:uncharacterized protein LOC131175825 n=1 Tax=Hevea brasiliensis TaxID=3981 RepID=UPI0025FF84D9|nr:uncharacterized protein LOC131175825 [Hevea brasiliensis]